MYCENFMVVDSYVDKSGVKKKKIKAEILSTDVPSAFPVDGTDIDRLDANYVLAPGSTIYVVNGARLFMADEDVNFVEQ